MWQAHSSLFPAFFPNIDWPLPVLSGVILISIGVSYNPSYQFIGPYAPSMEYLPMTFTINLTQM